MIKVGVTVGKFYPFHLGHFHLVDTMSKECDMAYVILSAKPDEKISESARWDCIYQELDNFTKPNVTLLSTPNDLPDDDSVLWAARTWKVIGEHYPISPKFDQEYEVVVYTSEDYGDPWAAAMGVKHRFVGREEVPISGTEVRAKPYEHFDMLPQSTKNLLTFTVVVVGPESSGKTTLCKDLAWHYDTVWVPEYGRYYTEGMRLPLNLDEQDLIHIGLQQDRYNHIFKKKASDGLIICDTDKLQTSVWAGRYLGEVPKQLELDKITLPDLYILCKPDFQWTQDGTRESKEYQWQMYNSLEEKISKLGVSVAKVDGDPSLRIFQSKYYINYLKEEKNYQ